MSHIPTFSMAELRAGKRKEEFRACLEQLGFFYLKDERLTDKVNRKVVDTGMDFFNNASEEQKAAMVTPIPQIRRGYSRLEKESTAKITNAGSYSDYSYAYSVGVGGNLYPSAAFEDTFSTYFDYSYTVAQDIAREVLGSFEIDCAEGLESFLQCDPVFRFRYYPDVPRERCADREPLRMAPHYDLSIVTLIQQTPSANGFVGLQCGTKDGFVDIPYQPDATFVMCGAVTTMMTRNRVVAPRHQVVAPPESLRVGSARNASVMFLRPRSEFEFSVAHARACGFDVIVTGETATFKDWIGGNYKEMRAED